MKIFKNTSKAESKLVAIAVPLSNRKEFTADEEISLRHLLQFLGHYDKFLVVPQSLEIDLPGFGIKRFNNKYFGSAKAHKQLMLSAEFYKRFIEYKYVLIYHLDALVFSDQLEQWCQSELDLIAPPWIKHRDAPYAGRKEFEGKVGNGGFSLRKIESFLKVIYSDRYYIDPHEYWQKNYAYKPWYTRCLNYPKKIKKDMKIFNNARMEMRNYKGNEDRFWANRAQYYYPEFKIASVDTALKFAFESVPRFCYEKNNRTLPFGCHAWERYDREFWRPFLLKG